MQRRPRETGLVLSVIAGLSLSACAGWGGGGIGGSGPNSITVLMVNNPQMIDLQELTAEHFTPETGITVSFTVLPDNDVRDKISQEFSSQAGQYDVASLSNFEIPIYAGAGWIAPMDEYIAADPTTTGTTSWTRWRRRCHPMGRSTASHSTVSPPSECTAPTFWRLKD